MFIRFDFLDYRSNNRSTLLYLGIKNSEVKNILANLTYKDYTLGPENDRDRPPHNVWKFGVHIQSEEIYIKLSGEFAGDQARCISFHIANGPLAYPYRAN